MWNSSRLLWLGNLLSLLVGAAGTFSEESPKKTVTYPDILTLY